MTHPVAVSAPWFAQDAEAVASALDTDQSHGLTQAEAARRLAQNGPNSIVSEPAPSIWQLALRQAADPMNVMLLAVAVISLAIGQISVGIIVAVLFMLNIVLGTRQEMSAKAAVDGLAKLQIPRARVVRDGAMAEVEATDLVVGEVLLLEAGDIVPADGRIVRSASLETQEAALTGESAPIAKDAETLEDTQAALGDRTDMVFQNTQVTRGTATVIVTATGMDTEMGRIASMLSAVKPVKSPLQRELDGLTRVLGWIAWGSVAVIVVIGLLRGQEVSSVLFLGISMAISAIPTGLPTFVQAMLSSGARELADHDAIVKNLTDVETLGATNAINSDKTGTLTMNAMTVQSLSYLGRWYTVSGSGYEKTGDIRAAAGDPVPDFRRLAYALTLCSDATVADDETVVGDPTEAALVVLAAKIGVDAELSRREYPRVAEVPFDSDYKYMATFHLIDVDGRRVQAVFVKGGPDVVLARCASAATPEGVVPIEEQRDAIVEANATLSSQGLRVLALALRILDPDEVPSDPQAEIRDLTFIAQVGIIDPLRPSSKSAVEVAREAGIEVRMITGDHVITAAAIGSQLGLAQGAASGAELEAMSDDELRKRLPDLHVFGRVTPQDKLRLARLMQQDGAVVAMTGDAVNDAAALKQADIGVAMGSGSEVTKQAARMILVDDNFGTLVTAVRLGRAIYDRIVGYVNFQMSQLLSLVLLFLVASVFGINQGVALTPLMVLFLNFFVVMFPVIVILQEPAQHNIMKRPPRDPKQTLGNPAAVGRWALYGFVLFAVTLAPLLMFPGLASPTTPNPPVTMAFVAMSFGSLLTGLVVRRDPESGIVPPVRRAIGWLSIPAGLTVAAVEIGFLQRLLGTTSLSGSEWLICIGLSLLVPVVIEVEKALRRRRMLEVSSGRADVGRVTAGR